MRQRIRMTTLVVLIVVGIIATMARANRAGMSPDPGYEAFLRSVRAGVLSAVPNSTDQRAGTGDPAMAFVASRSGAVIDRRDQMHLAKLEREYSELGTHGVRADDLAAHLTDWLLDDVLATLSPSEIEGAIEAWRGFQAVDLPESFKHGRTEVRLHFAEPPIILTPVACRQAIESLQMSDDARDAMRAELRERVTARVAERLSYLTAADPTRFRAESLSPVEALLITYSTITNDLLAGTNADLRERMWSLKYAIDKQSPTKYPEPSGRLPFGTNGYLVSSPLDCLFSRAGALIKRFE